MLQVAQQQIGEVNELMSFSLPYSLQTDGGAATLPESLEWRLVCRETGNELQAWTSITPTTTYDTSDNLVSVTGTVTVSGLLHAMQTSSLARERKALILVADRGANEYSLECTYNVVRLAARS